MTTVGQPGRWLAAVVRPRRSVAPRLPAASSALFTVGNRPRTLGCLNRPSTSRKLVEALPHRGARKEVHVRSKAVVTLVFASVSLLGGWFASPAHGSANHPFRAEFHDNRSCPAGFDLCGRGVVHGFGTVITALAIMSVAPGPGSCITATGVRELALEREAGTLRLLVEGTLCPQGSSWGEYPRLGFGTFTIAGGTGAFAGATGGGMLWSQGTGAPGLTDTAHYDGTLAVDA